MAWVALIVFSLFLPNPTQAHPVPDGVIFRGIQVVVWSDRIEIRYQVGLNDKMVQRELRALLPPDADIPSEGGQALRVYRDELFPRLPEKLVVTIDGEQQVLEQRRADIVRQLHIQIELVYRFDFRASTTPAHFLLIDDNFKGIPGYHLAAIKSRGMIEIPETNALSVLSRLSREPETPEDVEILNTPVRRVEAMIVAISPDESSKAADDAIASSGVSSEADKNAIASQTENAPRVAETSQPAPVTADRASTDDTASKPTERRPFLLPLFGGLLILVAAIWMFVVIRWS